MLLHQDRVPGLPNLAKIVIKTKKYVGLSLTAQKLGKYGLLGHMRVHNVQKRQRNPAE